MQKTGRTLPLSWNRLRWISAMGNEVTRGFVYITDKFRWLLGVLCLCRGAPWKQDSGESIASARWYNKVTLAILMLAPGVILEVISYSAVEL